MDRQAIVAELKLAIGNFLQAHNIELVDLIYHYEGKDLMLRILADRPEGGITLDECSFLNQEISQILDQMDLLQQRYILEVSSPGLDRPLTQKNDFLRSLNKRTRFFLNTAVKGKIEWEGTILKVENDVISVRAKDEMIEIPLAKINQAKLVIDISGGS